MKRKIYVASSWRNEYQQGVVKLLRDLGHEVYDFKNPSEGNKGFSWSEIDENWLNWTTDEYKNALIHPIAEDGYKSDFSAMCWADCCVMVLPCGRSANTEAGWMKGAGKDVFVYCPIKQEPELMYKIYDDIFVNEEELIKAFTIKKELKDVYDTKKIIKFIDYLTEEFNLRMNLLRCINNECINNNGIILNLDDISESLTGLYHNTLNNLSSINYKNWKGITSIRNIKPIKTWYGVTKFHTENQWFLKAIDLDKNEERDFAINDIIKN